MMEQNGLQIFTDIANQLGQLNANMAGVLKTLSDHNLRIQKLESSDAPSSFRDQLVRWLAIGLVAAIGCIATLTGSASLLKGIFGL